MKGHKPFGGGVLLVVALLLAAIPASAAAKASLLQFTEAGKPAAKGAAATLILSVGEECSSFAEGKLGEDPAKKVETTASALEFTSCEEGFSQTGYVEEETWESNGKLKIKADVEITGPGTKGPGPCVYTYTKFKADELSIPGIVAGQGKADGKLNKTASSKTKGECAKKTELEFTTAVFDEGFSYFEDELT